MALMWAIGVSLLAGLALVVGAMIFARQPRWHERYLESFLAIGAGFILSVALLEMLPELGTARDGMIWVLGGFTVVHLFEHILSPHFHYGEETHGPEVMHRMAGISALFGLAVHNFFTGTAIGSASVMGRATLGLVAVAVLLHKAPEGFVVGSLCYVALGRRPRLGIVATAALGACILAGAILAEQVATIGQTARMALYGLSIGSFLHVGATDLLPQVGESHRRYVPYLFLVGIALYAISEWLLAGQF